MAALFMFHKQNSANPFFISHISLYFANCELGTYGRTLADSVSFLIFICFLFIASSPSKPDLLTSQFAKGNNTFSSNW